MPVEVSQMLGELRRSSQDDHGATRNGRIAKASLQSLAWRSRDRRGRLGEVGAAGADKKRPGP